MATDVKSDGAIAEIEGGKKHQDALDTLRKVEGATEDQISHYEHFNHADQEWHKAMTKRLMRKVDFHLLPMLSLMYLLNFLDRK